MIRRTRARRGRKVARRGRRYGRRVRRATGRGLVHRFKETYQGTSIIAPAGGGLSSYLVGSLNSLTNVSSYTNLFDLYKITGMKVQIVPQWNTADFDNSDLLPILYVAPNRNPYVPPPASVADILNDDGVKIIRLTKPVTMYMRNPKPQLLATSQDGQSTYNVPLQFNSSSSALQPWLCTGGNSQTQDQSALKHFGWRYWIDNVSSGTQNITVHVYYTLYFSCKEQD